VARRELFNVLKKCLRRRRSEKRQVVVEGLFVNFGCDRRVLEDGFDFRCKDEPAILVIVIERFYPNPISYQHELLESRIPQSDGIVAFDVVNEVEPTFLVKMKNGLRVSAGSVYMAAFFQPFSKLCMVVNLTVEHQPELIRTPVHGLMAGFRQINDRQPSKAKPTSTIIENEVACVVWTAMLHLIAHTDNQIIVHPCLRGIMFPNSADTTHD
jgi:hypothetical protein